MVTFDESAKMSIDVTSLSPLTARWLKSKAGVDDDRPIIYLMRGSGLQKMLSRRIYLYFEFGEGVMN